MTTEKLKRVQSIRRWLEKAEQSYLRHREVAGELNLLMAQAEMQRLKERDYTCPKRGPWKMRIIAFIVAAGLFSGLTFWQNCETETTQFVPVSVIQEIPSENGEDFHALENMPEDVTDVPMQDVPIQDVPIQDVPVRKTESAPVAATNVREPLLSETEIQSVVGEAGRALRGQSQYTK